MKTYLSALVLAAAIALPEGAHAERPEGIDPPPVPDAIQVPPEEFTPYLAAHAIGTQGYVCVAVGSVFSWTPFGPQATLFNEEGQQILTHFLSPTPYSPVAQSHVAALSRLERRLGPGDQIFLRSELRGTRCDSLAAAGSRCRRGRPHRGRQADGHQVHPSREYRGRARRPQDRLRSAVRDIKKRALARTEADWHPRQGDSAPCV